ncbi:MAG TPA: TerC family protein [Candidatus Acidoferrum sp.]|nr:TerC family protein [Candidatus Acidoferrum sp.]
MGTPLRWLVFNLFVLAAVALDLGVFHRRPHKLKTREALLWSFIWIGLTLLFGIGVFVYAGEHRALEFFTGYVIEKALSVDNLFLFLVIFRAFAVEEAVQHRVLEWGILGALLMRGVMIAAGAELIERFDWVLYVLGAFLVYAGLHMLFEHKEKMHPEENRISRFAAKHLRVTTGFRGTDFFARERGKLFATPLFVVLLVVEITDITLAVDSIPAIFGVTRDPFIVYTSNVFAILGLRAMYFLLAGVLGRLRYLTAGLAVVLMFIGAKMIVEPWVHISIELSLAIVAGLLLLALGASLLVRPKTEPPVK